MKILSWGTLCLMWLAAVCPATGQIYWDVGFERVDPCPDYPFCGAVYGLDGASGSFPQFSEGFVDIGPPQNHVLRVQVDSSNNPTNPWAVSRVAFPSPQTWPTVVYDPEHTFFKFDLLVSQRRPLNVRLQYCNQTTFDSRDLDIDVTPSATNSFERFVLPLSGFRLKIWDLGGGAIPDFPTTLTFGISGNPTNAAVTWPSAADNVFMVDNIAYIIEPPLSIGSAGDNVVLSWATNTAGFVLEQSAEAVSLNWTTVTNVPVQTNDLNQVILPRAAGQTFYRLRLTTQ